jgi:hypothetical protein
MIIHDELASMGVFICYPITYALASNQGITIFDEVASMGE